ncbi:E3 ubiquitin-protein ligase rnf14 [Rhizoclosmatium sp. JEL0117]|nr:E3 ubiquitin-protein ligase rnf14 [Rhizoclosmatium sp. JEL0117]
MDNNRAEQQDELEALQSIYNEDFSCQITSGDADPVGRLTVRMQLPGTCILPLPSVEGVAGSSVTINYLPPVVIHFSLPKSYPSETSPHFSLSCDWLPLTQRRKLHQGLKDLCEQTIGNVVLFSLGQYVVDESIGFLELLDGDTINLTYNNPQDHLNAVDALVAADREHAQYLFSNSTVSCGICMESKLGSKCHQFIECRHAYCCACLEDYFTVHITEGQVLQVTCPDASCKKPKPGSGGKLTPLPPSSLSFLPRDLISRYTSLLETHDLLQKPNLTYCPRPSCNAPTVKDPEEEKLCICSQCSYAFCFFCNRTWHGYASYCQIRHLETIAKEYISASEQERKTLEIKYGKKTLEKVVREIEEAKLNASWLKENAQACPNCTCLVERSEGCCHMTCKVCSTHFCFNCGERLNPSDPYRHYNTQGTRCFGRLFEGTVMAEYDPLNDPAVMGDAVLQNRVMHRGNEEEDDEYLDIPEDVMLDFIRR